MKTKPPGIVEELKEKYQKRLAHVEQDWKKEQAAHGKCGDNYISDITLFYKWAYRVGKGWYGFALGNVPRVWTDMIDEFLNWLETQCPDFEIHQVKIKGLKVRLHLGTKTDIVIRDEKIRSEIFQLENLLSLTHLYPHKFAYLKKYEKPHMGANKPRSKREKPQKSTKIAK